MRVQETNTIQGTTKVLAQFCYEIDETHPAYGLLRNQGVSGVQIDYCDGTVSDFVRIVEEKEETR